MMTSFILFSPHFPLNCISDWQWSICFK